MSSEDTLSIINIKGFKETKINHFFTYEESFGSLKSTPVCAVRMNKPDTVIGLVCFQESEYCLNCIYITDKFQQWLYIKKFIPDSMIIFFFTFN